MRKTERALEDKSVRTSLAEETRRSLSSPMVNQNGQGGGPERTTANLMMRF